MPPSKSDTHITPDKIFDMILDKWGYDKTELFDPCPVNPKKDGLKIRWNELNYVNPPYTLLKEFVDKAIRESFIGAHTIMLLPSKTDQEWFHKLINNKYEILWIRRRLKFKNNKWSATQPHFLVLIK
jgi:hypothetical protein